MLKICPECFEGNLIPADACAACKSPLADQPPRPGLELEGMAIAGTYRLDSLIAEGGMSWVYRGTQLDLDRQIAIKLLRPSMITNPQIEQRFIREARTSAMFAHPHIVAVLDTGQTPGGLLYMITEYVRGFTLGYLLAQDFALPLPRVVRIFDQILSAVEAAHTNQIIHRDLKPGNIMLTRSGGADDIVKVLDFGIARQLESDDQRLTRDGQVFGTPHYMAPEQALGSANATAQSDLYACGIILFELLTGVLPFNASSAVMILHKQMKERPPSVVELSWTGRLPDSFDALIQRSLAKDSPDRFQTVDQLRTAFRDAVRQADLSGG